MKPALDRRNEYCRHFALFSQSPELTICGRQRHAFSLCERDVDTIRDFVSRCQSKGQSTGNEPFIVGKLNCAVIDGLEQRVQGLCGLLRLHDAARHFATERRSHFDDQKTWREPSDRLR